MPKLSSGITRRVFVRSASQALAAASLAPHLAAQLPGARPEPTAGITVLNPRCRVPVGLIIDDSTCLVNLNRFAMPQFDEAFDGSREVYHKPWRDWPVEIPDAFVRKFGEWCASEGVKGKYSIVPFPACVGRVDRLLPGWSARELEASRELVRTLMTPNWDIHPEMVTHTRVIDLETGHPYADASPKFMENWDWTTGKSADEIGAYLAYGLQILKDAGFTCEGVTTPGGFGNKALPQLSQATLQAARAVYAAEVPHYFRHLYDSGDRSVAPRVENASALESDDPQCVVSVIGCTGDWTGGWDCTTPEGADRFITKDLKSGRMVEVITRGEPAMMVCHWTGIYWNGQELGFKVFQEVVRRLHARFDNLLWMKLSELSRYWAAKELTRIDRNENSVSFHAPFACPEFTIRITTPGKVTPRWRGGDQTIDLKEVAKPLLLVPGTWYQEGESAIACFALPRGRSTVDLLA